MVTTSALNETVITIAHYDLMPYLQPAIWNITSSKPRAVILSRTSTEKRGRERERETHPNIAVPRHNSVVKKYPTRSDDACLASYPNASLNFKHASG